MQIFMPFSDLRASVSCLDPKRLGNQVYREGLTLIRGGWPNHPCSRLWQNHKHALAQYCIYGLEELERRGRYYSRWFEYFNKSLKDNPDTGLPSIIGDKDFHLSHRSNLIRKNSSYYRPLFGLDVPDNLPYIWPR